MNPFVLHLAILASFSAVFYVLKSLVSLRVCEYLSCRSVYASK